MRYKAEAVLGLSNWGGVSIMLDPEDSDYLYYQWYEEEPVRAEIYYMEDEEDITDVIPVFNMEEGDVFRIDEFMRVDY